MNVISQGFNANTSDELVIFIFEGDDELNQFIGQLIETPALASGIRVLKLVPPRISEPTPIQKIMLDLIDDLDGLGGSNHEKIAENAIASLKNNISQTNDNNPLP